MGLARAILQFEQAEKKIGMGLAFHGCAADITTAESVSPALCYAE
jgi:hypothetical protein